MARMHNRLSVKAVQNLRKPGLYGDGDGLFLCIKDGGAKSWTFRYSSPVHKRPGAPNLGRQREAGLGPAFDVSLAQAREAAAAMRALIRSSIYPLDQRDQERAQRRLQAVRSITLKECAESFMRAHRSGWRSQVHADQWRASLERYAYPIIGDMARSSFWS